MKKIFLKNMAEDMYSSYKDSQISEGKIPLNFEDWERTVLKGKGEKREKTYDNSTVLNTTKNFYTYEEAAVLLNKAASTIKLWIKEERHQLVLLEKDKIDKLSVDMLVLEFANFEQKYIIKENYEKYVKKSFLNKEEPYSYQEWIETQSDETKGPINFDKYMHFSDALNSLQITEPTLKTYIRNGSFKLLVDDIPDYLLKEDVLSYRAKASAENERRRLERLERKRLEEAENEIKNLLKDCFVGGYIRCNNSFVKEDRVTHITTFQEYNILIKSKDDLNTPSLLANDKREAILFESKAELNIAMNILLKYIEQSKRYKY